MRARAAALALLLAGVVAGCSDSSAPTPVPTPAPSPTPTPGPGSVVAGAHTGPTQISFVEAEPPPGSTIDGCGRDARGCAGRARMRFRLLSASGGPVLFATAFLHATTKIACLRGTSGPLELRAGVPAELLIGFDQPDPACSVPATISDMKLVVEGPVETASLQEWTIRYELRP